MITPIDKVLYTAFTHTTSGRDGTGRSNDGALDVNLSKFGSGRPGTNPEQLFAVGWSACFMGALGRAAQKRKITLSAGVAVDAEVDLGQTGDEFFLRARLDLHLPEVDRALAESLAAEAHQICPYSKATRGNIEVAIRVV